MTVQIQRPQQIDLPSFSGPLDLLLHLIERNELDITALSLAKVTEQYLAQVAEMKERRMEQLIDFLLIGAQLALIKSRALLPKPPAILVEGDDEEDPAEALARRLRAYKQFKDAAGWLHERHNSGLRTYLRLSPPSAPRESQLDLSGITAEILQQALLAALAEIERLEQSVDVAQRRRFTIEGQIGRLRRLVRRYHLINFRELLSDDATRSEFSVTLLAVLELTKRREVVAIQTEMFGPIEITAYTEE